MDILICLMVFGPMAAAVLSYLIGRKSKTLRARFVQIAVTAEFLLSLCLLIFFGGKHEEHLLTLPGICGFGLSFTVDGFRSIYAAIASLMWDAFTARLQP